MSLSLGLLASLKHATPTTVVNTYQQGSQSKGLFSNGTSLTALAALTVKQAIASKNTSNQLNIGPAYSVSLSSGNSSSLGHSSLSGNSSLSGFSFSSLTNALKGSLQDQAKDFFSDLEFGGSSGYGGIAGAGAANSNANPHPGRADTIPSTPMGAGGPYTGDQNVHSEPNNENNNDGDGDGDGDD